MHATRNPDGSFTHGGVRYRLVERGDDRGTLDVVSEEGGDAIGSFVLVPDPGSEPRVEITSAPQHRDTLRAISSLLEHTRGSLPLQ